MTGFPKGRVLEVDLSNEKVTTRIIDEATYRLYPGGSALGMYLLLNELQPGIDPLSPENVLIFSVSPLTGLPISGISRVAVTTKSPLTGTAADSQAGGFFPVHLKANGWDAIVIKGKAAKPVYLYIDKEKVEIRDGRNIWGKVTGEAETAIKEEITNQNVEIAQIGPGGENLVRYASIMNMCNRANGRNGTGAVMGSKNLKALVVGKQKGLQPFDAQNFLKLSKSAVQRLKGNVGVAGLGENGTDGDLEGFSQEGFLPTKNWTTGYFPEGAEKITGTTMTKTILKKRDTCYSCVVRCKRVVEIEGKVDPLYGGPEYETCGTFGSYCGISDLEEVAIANQLCNMYGLDTISCGATIAFAMECYEKGLINDKDTGGLKLNFGNSDVLEPLIKSIAFRDGFGGLLAEGSRRAAEKIGKDALSLSISVKSQEFPAHMPQYKPSVGLIYAVNPFGADHQSSEHDPFLMMPEDSEGRVRLKQLGIWKGYDNPFELDDEKVRFAFETQCYFSILDTLCLCQFVWGPSWELYGPSDMVELCKYGIGWETSMLELMKVGERRINMMRYFNSREGFTKDDDKLPERIFEPMPDGASKGTTLDKNSFYNARDLYYEYAGWDKNSGNPQEAVLRRLSLGWLLDM